MTGSLAVVILTRDRPESIANSLSHHVALLKDYNIPLYVFDNSIKTDNSKLAKDYPDIKYHKHEKDLSYDESFKFAIEGVDADYVWVMSDRIKIMVGAIPFIQDYTNRYNLSAIQVGCNARLSFLGFPYIHSDRNSFMMTTGWHSTLCGSTIYHRDTIKKADTQKYMGHGFVHLGILFDGITKSDNDMLVIPQMLTIPFDDMSPAWMPKHIEIWTKDLYELMMLLPDNYSYESKIELCSNNGYNGALLTDPQFIVLARSGCFNEKILDTYLPFIKKVCDIPEGRLRMIAIEGNKYTK